MVDPAERRLLGGLESHVIQQDGLGERSRSNGIGVMNTFPPTEKVQQVLSIATKGEVGHAAEAYVIQIAIDPIDLAAGVLLDDAEGLRAGLAAGW